MFRAGCWHSQWPGLASLGNGFPGDKRNPAGRLLFFTREAVLDLRLYFRAGLILALFGT